MSRSSSFSAAGLTALRVAFGLLLGIVATGLSAQVIQTNYGSNDATIPGGLTISSSDLLQTQLLSATRSASGDAAFYRETSGYSVVLGRLSDGVYGTFGSSGLGGDGNYTVMPNNVTITFTLDTNVNTAGYALSAIRTFASWDDGRDGQSYTVEYATVSAPATFVPLYTLTPYNPTGFDDPANTVVELTATSGDLAINVAALRFVFSGYENSGTAYREFDVIGTAAVPEPSTSVVWAGLSALILTRFLRRRAS